jgi:hypothetical protein
VTIGECAVRAWSMGAARKCSMCDKISFSGARCSLAAYSRWSIFVTGHVDARGSGVKR